MNYILQTNSLKKKYKNNQTKKALTMKNHKTTN